VPATDAGRFANAPAEIAAANLFNINGAFSDKTDTGKLDVITATPPESWKAAFRTPSLRGVVATAPYMHSGQLATLSAVIDFYAAGGTDTTPANTLTPFTISAEEKADLIDFLGTLTGKPVAAALTMDTSSP
jgi:cytochrome c peroxidase